MSREEWRNIAGTFGAYKVSNLGRVQSWIARNGKELPYVLKPEVTAGGYERVRIRYGRTYRRQAVHRLVLEAFSGLPEPDQEARHLDGNQRNNRADNLTWGTKSENRRDRIAHGTDHQKAKTHCPQGHPYSPENTYRAARGDRQCRECHRARQRVDQPNPDQAIPA